MLSDLSHFIICPRANVCSARTFVITHTPRHWIHNKRHHANQCGTPDMMTMRKRRAFCVSSVCIFHVMNQIKQMDFYGRCFQSNAFYYPHCSSSSLSYLGEYFKIVVPMERMSNNCICRFYVSCAHKLLWLCFFFSSVLSMLSVAVVNRKLLTFQRRLHIRLNVALEITYTTSAAAWWWRWWLWWWWWWWF